MNNQQFAQLASQAQAGDKASLEQLLLLAYPPVSYQCRKLLKNTQAADSITQKVLQRVSVQLHTLKNPALFEKWLANLTAKHCMRALQQQTFPKNPSSKKLHVPSAQLDELETAMVIDQIVDALPDDLRICITLYCCKISISTIGKITGFEEAAVKAHLSRGQALINRQLQKLTQQGIHFAPVTSLPELLQIAMYTPREPEAASAMVNGILKKRPVVTPPVPKQAKTVPILKLAIAVVVVLLMLMVGLIFFLEQGRRAELEQEEATATADATTQSTEATISPTSAATIAETTMETTTETTVETTLETTEATTEATTEPTTEPVAQAQQIQTSQPTSSSGNAPSAPGGNVSSVTTGNTSTAIGSNTSTGTGGNHVHSYQDAGPIGVTPAGCESPGSRLKICFVCGDQVRYVDEVGLPARGHSYSSKVRAPTEGSEGFTIHTCTRCGKTYMDNYVPKLPAATQAPPAPQPEVTPDPQPEANPDPQAEVTPET